MTTRRGEAQGVGHTNLTIGDLARRTGVSTALLRTWETRHGFPVPQRRASGHRRYSEADVLAIKGVLRRRAAGVRLEVAIAEALAGARPPLHSVYAELRRHDPRLASHQLRKRTLLALSWAIEDECCARAQRPTLFGAFQEERFYRRSRRRWRELARTAAVTVAMADFPAGGAADDRIDQVALPEDSPMRREWVVVCDAADLPAALAAWELPGQDAVPDRQRLFESVWTVDTRSVRHAARVCAQVALASGAAAGVDLVERLAGDATAADTDLTELSSLFGRVLAYADRLGP